MRSVTGRFIDKWVQSLDYYFLQDWLLSNSKLWELSKFIKARSAQLLHS